MIDWILSKLGLILELFNSWTGSYLLAVFLFALIFKIILFPFSLKQQKGQLKQAKLQPKVAAIRKKYNGRDDAETKQKIQQETMDLYKSEGYNPMSGCLPLLLQFPIIIALYQVIQHPLRYICGLSAEVETAVLEAVGNLTEKTYTSSLGVIQDLKLHWSEVSASVEGLKDLKVSDLPEMTIFKAVDLSVTPNYGWYLLIPLLTFATVFLSSKLTRKLSYMQQDPQMNGGCSGWVMDLIAPAMSTYFSFILPALLGVYWMFNNLLSVVQQLILRLMYPAPVFTEADYKEAERALRGKGPRTPATDSRVIPGKKYVSLHHIDDDDETELPVLPIDSREQDDEEQASESEAPRLKDESDRPSGKKKNGKNK